MSQYSSAEQIDISSKVSCLIRSPILGNSGAMTKLTPSTDAGTQFQTDSMNFKGLVVAHTRSLKRFTVMNNDMLLMTAVFRAVSTKNPTDKLDQNATFQVYERGRFFAQIDCRID